MFGCFFELRYRAPPSKTERTTDVGQDILDLDINMSQKIAMLPNSLIQ